jgi:superfamily II DNA or RNA helicase
VTADTGLGALKLRDYQQEAIAAVHRAWAGEQRGTGTGVANRVAVVLATGLGKTVIFAHPDFRRPILARRPGSRMLVLVHRDELAAQAVAKVHSIDPSARVGRVQAQHDDVDAEVIVASVQTLARERRRERIRDVGLIVIDEAHHSTSRTYVEVLRHFGAFSGVPTAGFSATLGRGDDGKLGDIFSEVVIERDIAWGIRGGHLVDVRGKRVQVQGLDLSAVRRVGGDLSADGVASALDDAQAPEQVAKAYLEHAGDRQGVAFWPDVATSDEGAAAMNALGIPAAVVTGSTSIDERADIFGRLRRGDLQVVSNCMVLTEGWDEPQVSCAAIVRPTQSAPLYTQMAGRVLRPYRGPAVPGFAPKTDALILDFVGVASRHKLATIADLSITTQVRRDELGDDVSLLDTIDEIERADGDGAAAGVERPLLPDGPLVTTEVELFSESAMLWLQTRAGTWFVPPGPHLLFLWPEPGGLWTIGQAPSNMGPGNARPLASGMMLDLAMRHAEQCAAVLEAEAARASASGARLSTRSASWRQGSRPATEAQLAYAARLGLSWPDERPTKATVSDAISVAKASFVLGG